MAGGIIEKEASELNRAFLKLAKTLPKPQRKYIRLLLAETADAVTAKPYSAQRCADCHNKIQNILQIIAAGDLSLLPSSDGGVLSGGAARDESQKVEVPDRAGSMPDGRPGVTPPQVQGAGTQNDETRHTDDVAPAPPADESAAQPNAPQKDGDDGIGLFDLISVQIRCFFKIRACVRPPDAPKFASFAEQYSDSVFERVEKFLKVLSGDSDGMQSLKAEQKQGYGDDLIPDMPPERGLILYPKRKKRGR